MAAYTPNAGAKEVLKTGKLWKEPPKGATMMRSWKKRWFVLEKDSSGIPCMRYYANEALTQEKGTIIVGDMTDVRPIDNPPPDPNRPKGGLVFEISASQVKKNRTDRRYMLVTSSEVDRRGWLDAIKALFSEEQLKTCTWGKKRFSAQDLDESELYLSSEGVSGSGSSASDVHSRAAPSRMKRESIVTLQQDYVALHAGERRVDIANQIFVSLSDDDFFLYKRATALREAAVALNRGDYSVSSEQAGKCTIDPSLYPAEVSLYDWRACTFYVQNVLTGAYRNSALPDRLSTLEEEAVEHPLTMNEALIEWSEAKGGPGMVAVLAATLRIQTFRYSRRARKIAAVEREVVKAHLLEAEEIIENAASSADATAPNENVNAQIDLIISHGIDLVKDAAGAGNSGGRSADDNNLNNSEESTPALIMAGISGSVLVRAPDDSKEMAEVFGCMSKLTPQTANGKGTDADQSGTPEVVISRRQLRLRCNEQEIQSLGKEKFNEFGGWIFKAIRSLFMVTPKSFVDSIQSGLTVIGSGAGRSGAFFFITHDKKFILKSVSKVESQLLMTLLPSYLAHVKDFPDTLLTRYYGMYSAEIGGRKSRFVIMNNLFENGMPDEAYDLKGSSVNRSVMPPAAAREKPGTVMKDMDLDKQLVLERNVRKVLCMQVKVDVEWLKQNDIMDYSLLLGISYDKATGYDEGHVKLLEKGAIKAMMKQLDNTNGLLDFNLGGRLPDPGRPKSKVLSNKVTQHKLVDLNATGVTEEDKMKMIEEMQKMSLQHLSGGSPAAETARPHSLKSMNMTPGDMMKAGSVWQEIKGPHGQVYSCGIIDMLQTYTVQKQMERTLKMVKAAGKNAAGISSMNSNRYSDRFLNYMFKVLIADEIMLDE